MTRCGYRILALEENDGAGCDRAAERFWTVEGKAVARCSRHYPIFPKPGEPSPKWLTTPLVELSEEEFLVAQVLLS